LRFTTVTGILFGLAIRHVGIALAIVLSVLAGEKIGAFSGFLIARFGLAAFVVTLGVMASPPISFILKWLTAGPVV